MKRGLRSCGRRGSVDQAFDDSFDEKRYPFTTLISMARLESLDVAFTSMVVADSIGDF